MSHVNFLGIPVEGTITPVEKIPQRPLSELQPLLLDLLQDNEITEFGWQQYTPYFNDGDPCVFRIHSIWVRTRAETDGDPQELLIGRYENPHPSLGGTPWRDGREQPYEGDQPERYGRARRLADALQSGEFCDVLLDAFGDHAAVAVQRERILVDAYDHE